LLPTLPPQSPLLLLPSLPPLPPLSSLPSLPSPRHAVGVQDLLFLKVQARAPNPRQHILKPLKKQ